MSDTKMFQVIIDGQVLIRKDIKNVERKLSKQIKGNGERIDRLGFQLANLEDDSPTVEEFNNLGKRVGKLEKQASI